MPAKLIRRSGELWEPDEFSRHFCSRSESLRYRSPGMARAADSDGTDAAAALKEIRAEMRQLREDRKHDREVIRSLQVKVQQLEIKDSRVETTTQQLQNTDQKLKETTLELQQTNQQVKTLQTKVDAPIAAVTVRQRLRSIPRLAHVHRDRRGRRRIHL